jgi:hypothetical protein
LQAGKAIDLRGTTSCAQLPKEGVAWVAKADRQVLSDGSSWARWVKKPFGHDGIEKLWIADIHYTHMSCRYSLWCRATPGK